MPLEHLEELRQAMAGEASPLVREFLDLARAASLEARAVVVETGVDEARMRQILGRCLTAHARALQTAYAREAERLARRAAEMSPVNWEQILALLEACRAAGFAPAGVEGRCLRLWNPTSRRVSLFFRGGRLWRLANPRRALRVRSITLVVGPPSPRGFTEWECLVDADRHPNVRDGKLCAGQLRGRDLLAEDTVRAIVAAVEVPNLDSAYWRPNEGELEPAEGPEEPA